MMEFLVRELPGMGIGFVAGAFCPSVLRTVKSWFVKESKVAEAKAATYGADLKKKL